MNNRGFRELGSDNILQVKFRDDSLGFFPREENLLGNTVKKFLTNGLNIAGRQFFDFGESSSLFREHGAYFYSAESQYEILDIVNSLGVFKEEPAAKVAARLGQYFTSAKVKN